MQTISVELRNALVTQAALGRAGSHSIVVDRPSGRAGGLGLGFNGAQLLALTIGGCFCNDLQYVAHADGVELEAITVFVALQLEGDPIITTRATMSVSCRRVDGASAADIIEKATAICMAINSLSRGVAVDVIAAA